MSPALVSERAAVALIRSRRPPGQRPLLSHLRNELQATLGDAYSIERELGGGGMSRVFVARDQTLGRDVVVKVIAPENAEGLSAERFAREVKLAARLQQANIVPLLAAGTSGKLPFYTMPFVRGESLRARLAGEPLGLAEAVSILRDVARALAYAHAEGVVHRDIKPENVLLSGGAAVVTDFGIAKALDESRTHDDINVTGITRAGTSLGTPAYMAPEQALGDPLMDFRADIYSWGVIAFELLGGVHPFAGRSTLQAMVAAHVTETPPSLLETRATVPPALSRLVMQCLEKQPAKRPASAAELVSALESVNVSAEHGPKRTLVKQRTALYISGLLVVAAAILLVVVLRRSSHGIQTTSAKKSLAVLPFLAAGGDTANSYLGEGIAEEVSNTLARVPGLRLAGRTSAARIARTGGLSAQEVAKRLDVSAVLDGTVRRVGDHVRITVELTSGNDGSVIWHESYDRAANDVFAVQSGIARAIAGQLQVTLVDAGTVGETKDAAAHDLYLRGLYLFRRRGQALVEAISDFEQATARDSTFARAWAGLASALAVAPSYLDTRMSAVLPRARDAAERAVRLDSMLSEAHLALGYVEAESFHWDRAETELRRAVAIDPGAVEARYRLGYMLQNMHRWSEVIPVLQQAKALDPMYFIISSYLGAAQMAVGQVAEGLAESQRGLELEPTNVAALASTAHAYDVAGMRDSAVAVARRLVAVTNAPGRHGLAAFVLARNGQRAEAEAIIRRLESLPEQTWTRSSGLAMAYLGISDTARAETYMERAVTGDGDMFVLLSTLVGGDVPRDARSDAVWRRYHLDPTRMGAATARARP